MRAASWVIGIGILAPALAAAQPAVRTGEAESLFRDGKAMIKAGRIAEACEAFAGSQRLEPNPGTLMSLADCRERNGELATAWALFLQAEIALRSDPGREAAGESARQKAAALEARLSHLVIDVPEDSRIEGLRILRDGVEVDRASWGRAMPVDGGAREIAVTAPGHEVWRTTVAVGPELDRQAVVVPRLARAATDGERPGAPVPAGRGVRGKLAIGVGVAAVAALGGAVAFELAGRSAYDEYERTRDDETFRAANGKHHVAQGLAIAGVACAGAATYLWLTSGRGGDHGRTALAPIVAPSFAGLAVRGGF